MRTRALAIVMLLCSCRSPDMIDPSYICGNAVQEFGEACDIGGTSCRLGCTPECRLEPAELLVIDLNAEATGDPGGRFHWDGPAALLGSSACDSYSVRGRTFVYVPPADGQLRLVRARSATWVVDGVEPSACEHFAAPHAREVRGGVPMYLRQASQETVGLEAVFLPVSAPGEACDPTGTSDYCSTYSVCDGGRCVEDADRGCGVNVPLFELPAPDEDGISAVAGSTLASSTHSFPASCARPGDAQRIHRLVLPYRARVRARASGGAAEVLAAGTGGCRADAFVELSCQLGFASEPLHADLGILPAGTEAFFMVGGELGEYALRVSVERLPDAGERCDPGDPRATCPEGSACVDAGGGYACVSGGDAGCGAGVDVTELEPSRAGGVVQLTVDPVLASAPSASCAGPFGGADERDRLFHLRMPFTARVTIAGEDDERIGAHIGACDAPITCERALGEIAEGTDLWLRVSNTRPLVLRVLLERDLAEGEPCEPSRFTDRCPSGASCASDAAGGFACLAGADLGCGAGNRIEPMETLPDGSGLYTGSTSTASGHREMQICDRRLGATLEVLHRWTAPADGTLVARTTLRDGALVSVRTAACDTTTTLECVDADSRDPIRVDGVRAGEVYYLALDAVPDGVEYELVATVESDERETPCGVAVCAPDETCSAARGGAWGDGEARCEPRPVPPACGNAIVEGGELCDDGNAVDGDGCAPDCTAGTFACEP